MGSSHISLSPCGEGTADKLKVDWFVTHQDREGSQPPSERVQGDSKSYREVVRLSVTGLAARRILYHSSSPSAFLTLMCFTIPLWLKNRGSIKEINNSSEATTQARRAEYLHQAGIIKSMMLENIHMWHQTSSGLFTSRYIDRHTSGAKHWQSSSVTLEPPLNRQQLRNRLKRFLWKVQVKPWRRSFKVIKPKKGICVGGDGLTLSEHSYFTGFSSN